MKLILVRHGQTLSNIEDRYSGTGDSPLSGKGKEQAKSVALELKKEELSAFYSSPQGRAVATGRKIGKFHKTRQVIRDELREIDYGEYEGRTLKEIDKQHPHWLEERRNSRYYSKPPGGESYAELEERLKPFLEEILGKKGTILIVAHSNVNKAIIRAILKLDKSEMNFGRLYQPNDCIYFLEKTGDAWEISYKLVDSGDKDKGYLCWDEKKR